MEGDYMTVSYMSQFHCVGSMINSAGYGKRANCRQVLELRACFLLTVVVVAVVVACVCVCTCVRVQVCACE